MATNYIFLCLQTFNTDQHKITQQPLSIIKEDLPCMPTQKSSNSDTVSQYEPSKMNITHH